MRHFPFKTLILCVLLPPLVYVFSIHALEKRVQQRYEAALAAAVPGDTRALFNGSVRLQDAIRSRVDTFLAQRKLIRWGLHVMITVKTTDGTYLYPEAYEGQKADLGAANNFDIARENFRLLSEGLIRTVQVSVEHNTLIANTILFFYVFIALMVLAIVYRRSLKKTLAEDLAQRQLIDDLSLERRERQAQLEQLESQRTRLSKNIERMKAELDRERQKASATEEEMMDELLAMEEKIGENVAQQDQQLEEIESLKQKILLYEKEKEAKTRQQLKSVDAARKRFGALYKNLAIHDRAVEGYVDLSEELKIKAEEVVHQLNDDPKRVQIKRKVFGKKNRETVFEIIFAYKGRLYFRNLAGNRVEVLVIGTKLTQNKDLSFLDNL